MMNLRFGKIQKKHILSRFQETPKYKPLFPVVLEPFATKYDLQFSSRGHFWSSKWVIWAHFGGLGAHFLVPRSKIWIFTNTCVFLVFFVRNVHGLSDIFLPFLTISDALGLIFETWTAKMSP